MPWKGLKERFGADLKGLANIIAGPILRKTTYESVSVWIAFKKDMGQMVLKVHEFETPGIIVASSVPTLALQFGENLWVTVLTANILDRQRPLKGNSTIYFYDIHDFTGSIFTGDNLINWGKITFNIGYYSNGLPSFTLPNDNISKLKFFHGSCRRPHAHGKAGNDALPLLDQVLDTTSKQNLAFRPQLLFLTGDQIYADDVAESLLYMLMDAKNVLFGAMKETLPKATNIKENSTHTEIQVLKENLIPGKRQNLIKDNGLSSSDGKSHLIELGEYYAMYLFVWSDVLWPSDYPKIEDVNNNMNKLEQIDYIKDTVQIGKFNNGLAATRRILANIITYMTFDDHEITDDVFLTKGWCDRVFGANGAFGRRIILNGMSAYLLFQYWGNNPKCHETGDFKPLFDNLIYNNLSWIELNNRMLPPENAIYITDNTSFQKRGAHKLNISIRWDFQIEYKNFTVFVVDTRSKRVFDKDDSPAALIGFDDISDQLPALPPTKKFALIIFPPPVFNKALIAKALRKGLPFLVKNPIFSNIGPIIHYAIGGDQGTAEKLDLEEFEHVPFVFERFLERIAEYKKVIILSGDVHYGFSAIINYWKSINNPTIGASGTAINPEASVMVQLCSSALDNAWFPYAIAGFAPLDNTFDQKKVGWYSEHFVRKIHILRGAVGALVGSVVGPVGTVVGPLLDQLLLTHPEQQLRYEVLDYDDYRLLNPLDNSHPYAYKISFISKVNDDSLIPGLGFSEIVAASIRPNQVIMIENHICEVRFEDENTFNHIFHYKVDNTTKPKEAIHRIDFKITGDDHP